MNYLAAAVTVLLAAPFVLAYLLVVAAELAVVAWLLWQLSRSGRWNPLNHDTKRCAICQGKDKQ